MKYTMAQARRLAGMGTSLKNGIFTEATSSRDNSLGHP